MKEKFDVTGMSCSACSSHVEKSVGKLAGVENVSVNLLTNSMQVEFKEEQLTTADIIKAVEDAGYGASIKAGYGQSTGSESGQGSAYGAQRGNISEAAGSAKERSGSDAGDGLSAVNRNIASMKKRLIVSLVFWIPLMYVSMGHMVYNWLGIPMPWFTANYLHGHENAITYAFTQLLLLVPILVANQKYFKNGFKTLIKRSPNMDSLIAIGAGAAIVYGIFAIYRIGYGMGHGDMAVVQQYSHDLYFESAGTILTLITVGKYLETRSKGKTSEAITKLMNLAPKTVTVVRGGNEQVIDARDVVVGDIFLVKPGEAVAVDGIVEEGKSSFDESAITGESIPVLKQAGDNLVSASINKSGLIRARAVKVGEDTTIAQIIRLVEEASSSKAPIAKMADKIAGVFVPTVITIALITGIIWFLSGAGFEFAMSTAIAVLVISCPCALGLATPVAIMVGTGKGAENGILIKSGDALEMAHQIDTVVLDKTGTITQGKPVVTDIICDDAAFTDGRKAQNQGGEKAQTQVTGKTKSGTVAEPDNAQKLLLHIAGTLEKGSEHPLAEAIVNYCEEHEIVLGEVKDFRAIFGKGIEGKITDATMEISGIQTTAGTSYYAGNEAMLQEKGILLTDKQRTQVELLAKQGKTPLLFASEQNGEQLFLGMIAVADVVKPTSKEAVSQFQKKGINVIMLTGDNAVTANAIKEQVGVNEVIAGVLPTEKEKKISELKRAGHKVAMVGDGINDAPALASADVGIAIGAGTDVAIESADIVLMKNDLLDAVGAVTLSKAVIRNIKQNLFWAFFYNCIGIPLAAGVLYPIWGIKLNPMFGAAAMSLSSIFVVSNALRLRRVKLKNSNKKEERKEAKKMTKTMNIEGMMCGHCQARVEKALKEVPGVTEVVVKLEAKNAVVTAEDSVSTETLTKAVVDAGYEVTSVE